MNHQRHVIREAICTALVSAGTSAGARVFDHPYDPRTVFPALTVEDLSEQQRVEVMGPATTRPVMRSYSFVVSAEVQQTTAYARTRDQLLADVEAALASAVITGVKSILPVSYQNDFSNDGERPIAVGRQRFEALYYTPQGNPSATL